MTKDRRRAVEAPLVFKYSREDADIVANIIDTIMKKVRENIGDKRRQVAAVCHGHYGYIYNCI